ncbi:elongation factor P [Candidatus Saccharibacteria bacterium]|nr:elongation factor P [Candidatus Saccharibacteria bacterium]NCU40470.1 elongation factor P [Candidatus Saccharibacteria bacterium]
MYSPTDLKKGTILQIDSQPYRVLDYNQKVMGRGGSIVNVRLKNLITGAVIPKTYKGQDRIERAEVNSKTVQYLYRDGTDFYFMDPISFEQFQLAAADIDDAGDYLLEGDQVALQLFDSRVINVELPTTVSLEVTYTENAVRGDTSSAIQKDAKLQTGKVIKVPAFIKTGDVVRVDTRDGSYVERQK